MRSRRRFVLIGALAMGLAAARPLTASAEDGTPAPSASAPAVPAATVAQAGAAPAKPAVVVAQGAIVIALGDDAGPAARALAREAYADEALRPRIDDATARVLAGEAPPASGPAKLTEIAEVRKAAHAAQVAGTEAVARRLLASLGSDLGAALVVAVSVRADKPVARVLTVATGAFAPLEFSGAIEPQPDGSSRVKWTNVAGLLATLLGKPGAGTGAGTGVPGAGTGAGTAARPGPLAPKKDEEPTRSFWTSPWTWAGIGVVVAAGVVVFAVSQTQNDGGGLRLQGRVTP